MRADADLTPPAVADMIAELFTRLELEDVTLVGNDTGGALCQLVIDRHPERIGRLVLTNCDAFENFPPAAFRLAVRMLGRVPGAVGAVERLGRIGAVRRAVIAPLASSTIPDELAKRWIGALGDAGVRRDLARFSRGVSSKYTLDAASRFVNFEKPVLIARGRGIGSSRSSRRSGSLRRSPRRGSSGSRMRRRSCSSMRRSGWAS